MCEGEMYVTDVLFIFQGMTLQRLFSSSFVCYKGKSYVF